MVVAEGKLLSQSGTASFPLFRSEVCSRQGKPGKDCPCRGRFFPFPACKIAELERVFPSRACLSCLPVGAQNKTALTRHAGEGPDCQKTPGEFERAAALSKKKRTRRRVRRVREDSCGGTSHFPEKQSFPCRFHARKSDRFQRKLEGAWRGSLLSLHLPGKLFLDRLRPHPPCGRGPSFAFHAASHGPDRKALCGVGSHGASTNRMAPSRATGRTDALCGAAKAIGLTIMKASASRRWPVSMGVSPPCKPPD